MAVSASPRLVDPREVVEIVLGPNATKIHEDADGYSRRSDGSRDWAGYAGYSWQQIKANDMFAGSGSLAYYRGTSTTARNAGPLLVTEKTITKALQGSSMKTLQGRISLPKVEQYVRMLENGSTPPPIKVVNGIIVDGNHTYTAGRVFGVEPPTVPWNLSSTQAARAIPVQQLKIDPKNWGK